MYLQTYIQNLQIPQNFKDSILDINFSKNNPDYYQNYPSLFSNIFSISLENLELLNIAGFLYYQSTILSDRLIDDKDITKYPLIIIHINKQMRKGLIFMIFLITLIIALTSAQQVCLK